MSLPDISAYYERPGRAAQEEVVWVLDAAYRRQAAFVAERMKADGLRTVLELGCGSGLFAAQLRRLLPAVKYVGVDTCLAFLKMAARRAPELSFFEGDLRRTSVPQPWAELPADVVCCWRTLKHFGLHEWDAVLAHVLSLGRFAAFDMQTLPADLDDGRDYHHVFVTREHLYRAVAAAGHAVIDCVVTCEEAREGGPLRDLALWTRRGGP